MGVGRARARRQAGFTLIELMVALLVSSLLVGMILAIFSRMSLAYRGQQQIAGVQQVLAAARATLELDAKQAGLGMSQGFTSVPTGGAGVQHAPVTVTDSSTGPDEIALFYADPSTQAAVTSGPPPPAWPARVEVDAATGFSPGDLVVFSRVTTDTASADVGAANLAVHTACVAQIDPAPGSVVAGPPGRITLSTSPPWGWGPSGDGPCAGPPGPGTMVYKFVAHAYRIDVSSPARAALGALQQSATGALTGGTDWNDLAYGFSDLQTALRVRDGSASDLDGDGDAIRNWYSGANQAGPFPSTPTTGLLGMSISLVAHTDRDVEGIATLATPNLTAADPDHNAIGNRPTTVLPTAPAAPPAPPWPDPLLPGLRIYRYTTFQVDFRNLGVGR